MWTVVGSDAQGRSFFIAHLSGMEGERINNNRICVAHFHTRRRARCASQETWAAGKEAL